jgi:hypothetical protein
MALQTGSALSKSMGHESEPDDMGSVMWFERHVHVRVKVRLDPV